MYHVESLDLHGQFKVLHARVMDSKRKFTIAAHSYYTLSCQEGVDPEELLLLLNMSVTCAILSPAGPQKARILTILYKDERRDKVTFQDILEKMFAGQVIKRPDVKVFEDSLQIHQNVRGKEGYSVLEKALLEHNIEVISKIYKNISFQELGRFLEIAQEKAEKLISQMVIENRIRATLDQLAQMIEFESDSKQFVMFNSQITHVCDQINGLLKEIMTKHPDMTKNVVHLA